MSVQRDRRVPTARRVWVVRYVRRGSRDDVVQRYYGRRHDAEAYAERLRQFGRDPAIYVTETDWTRER